MVFYLFFVHICDLHKVKEYLSGDILSFGLCIASNNGIPVT